MQRLSNGLLPASVASAALTERLQQLLTIVEQNCSQLDLMATTHPSGSALLDAFVTQVSEVAPLSGSVVAANSGDDAALNSSVNTQSMAAVLRGPELSDFAVTAKHLDLSFHQCQLDLI